MRPPDKPNIPCGTTRLLLSSVGVARRSGARATSWAWEQPFLGAPASSPARRTDAGAPSGASPPPAPERAPGLDRSIRLHRAGRRVGWGVRWGGSSVGLTTLLRELIREEWRAPAGGWSRAVIAGTGRAQVPCRSRQAEGQGVTRQPASVGGGAAAAARQAPGASGCTAPAPHYGRR
jgi:hypothetical protein